MSIYFGNIHFAKRKNHLKFLEVALVKSKGNDQNISRPEAMMSLLCLSTTTKLNFHLHYNYHLHPSHRK